MAGFFVKRDRTVKPPLGTPLRTDGHWSVWGLVGCWLFNEGAGNHSTNLVLNGNFAWSNNRVLFDGATGYGKLAKNILPNYYGISAVVFLKCNGLALDARILSFRNSISGTPFLTFGVGDSSNTSLRLISRNINTTFTYNYSAPASLSVGVNFSCGFVADMTSGGLAKLYKAGKQIGSTQTATATMSDILDVVGVGAFVANSSASNFLSSDMTCVLIYNRALSPAEIASLSANPWQVAQPEVVYFGSAAAGNMFQSAWARQSNQILGAGYV